ncbi:alpha/beta hydrolase fold domain-containing protein [Erythrobacter sp. BLCC-B19]|uniref:alpha/beta hydrolase fold domain-containing protein n=1 Tax=Erythrobacter sp. BLCC-B19 TaxID=3025315 RepID=UPI002361A071|nr:alpha/beta hydrolase [Erythrobacter sp. BLCC-B19]WDA39637.1 alpha/beta hydrolase [Erythrobacter sp. BLCC-B19]
MTPQELAAMLMAARKPAPTIAEMAADMEELGASLPMPEGVVETPRSLGGIDGLWFAPEGSDARQGCILYLHGGGYGIGSARSHRALTALIAQVCAMPVWSIDYTLSTSRPFPAAIEDALAAFEALVSAGYAPGSIFVIGDSAGGGAAAAMALLALDRGVPAPGGLVLFSPWLDLTFSGASHRECGPRDPVVCVHSMTMMRESYLRGADPASRHASPALADLRGLPPVLIQVGSEELLLSDSLTFAERAGIDRVEVTLEVWPDMIHVFQAYFPHLEQAHHALARVVGWIAARIA